MQAVIFDFGNVLATFDKMPACERVAETSPYSAKTILDIILARLEQPLESGTMSDTAFCNELLHLCKVTKLTVPDVKRIWGNIFSPNPAINPVVDRLIALRKKIGVLSNTSAIHWYYMTDLPVARKLAAYGAPMTLSYEVGAYKPDKKLYEVALRSLGVDVKDALYLDDIPEYVAAARSLGMKAEQYDCRKDPGKIDSIMIEYDLL